MHRPAIRAGAAALVSVLCSAAARAQDPSPLLATQPSDPLVAAPHLSVAIAAGLALAVAFQFVFAQVSLAAGMSALRVGESVEDEEPAGPTPPLGHRVRRAVAGLGAWSLLTASLALFLATWLAVALGVPGSARAGAVVGLVIWALFTLLLAALQATAAGSLLGALLRTVGGGLRTAWSGALAASRRALPAGPAATGPSTPPEPAPADPDRVTAVADVALRLSGRSPEEATDVRRRVEAWLRSTGEEALDPDGIKRDLDRLLGDPAGVVSTRARVFARIRACLDALDRAGIGEGPLRDEVERRVLAARDETYRHAEEARRTAASAAWWSVVTAIASALAAAFGGAVAVGAG